MNHALVVVVKSINIAVEGEFTKGDLYQQKGGNLNQRYSYSSDPKIAVDNNNDIHVVWYDSRDGSSQVYYKRSEDDAKTIGQSSKK